jgi:hypothetical protein
MLPFLAAANLVDRFLQPAEPWAWSISAERLEEVRALGKAVRRARMNQAGTDWQVYTPVVGQDPGRRIGKQNPAAAIRGVVADYDVRTPMETVRGWLDQIDSAYRPQWVEVSLSKKVRLVWVFERPVPVADTAHAEQFYLQFARALKLATALPGYDAASEKATQVWTNGGEWHAGNPQPLAWNVLFGLAVTAATATRQDAAAEVPLADVETEMRNRFPGRWTGEFKLDATGVRFWDPTADNETGCQVKPDGMLCFTGNVGFMSWAAIFGARWVEEQRHRNLSELASGIYFDGRHYHRRDLHNRWQQVSREDIILQLTNQGINGQRERGQSINDVGRVLAYVQRGNSIDGAAPLIYGRADSVVEVHGKRVLNTSRLQVLEPATGICTPADFPFIDSWLRPAFVPVPGAHPYESCMAWAARFYRALREGTPALGQVLFLCGPVNCGKTLFSTRILAPLFGNRIVNPYDYLTGKTGFTDNLYEAAFWVINDEESPSEAARQVMLAKLKAASVNPTHEYHAKFGKRTTIPWNGRIMVTGNDDAQSVAMLPDVTQATRDKLSFYAFRDLGYRWPSKEEVERLILQELPAFANWLLQFEPPKGVLENTRMGVASYFDPRLLSLSQQQAYSHNAKELLSLWCRVGAEWTDRPEWAGNPTAVFAGMDNCELLKGVLRDWSVPKLSKALRSLALVPGTGVRFSDGQEREFIFTKELL